MTLTAAKIKSKAKPRSKQWAMYDSKGLRLLVMPTGSKYWRYNYRFAGKNKTLAIGVYPDISLANARTARDDAKALLAQGIDPGHEKKLKKFGLAQQSEATFQAIASEWFEVKMCDKSESHRKRTWSALNRDLFPVIGNRPIATISAQELLYALRKIESRGAIETAHRAKQTAGQIFRYAIATGRAERDPSPDLKEALRSPKKTHLAAITDPNQVGRLLLAIDEFRGTPTVKTALLLSPILFVRPGELRHMEWREINWEEECWEIPASKMKMRRPHVVPLPKQAIRLLKEIQLTNGRGRFVFPSARGASRPLSENGVRTALRTLGYSNDEMTPHGFRAMARTILDEVLGFRVDWIEHQMAHAVKDTNGRAYNRTSHLPERKQMMQDWADYLDGLKVEADSHNDSPGAL